MGIIDRVILTLYTLSLSGLSVLTILLSLGWTDPLDAVRTGLSTPEGRLLTGAVGGLFFIVSLRLMYSGFVRRPRRGALVQVNDLGRVEVSAQAVSGLVSRTTRQVVGVRDVKAASIFGDPRGGIAVRVRIAVGSDVSVPDVTGEVQRRIKDHVRDVVGVEVGPVQVAVEAIGDDLGKKTLR